MAPSANIGVILGILVAGIVSGSVFGDDVASSGFGIHGALVIYYYMYPDNNFLVQLIVHVIAGLLLVYDTLAMFIVACVGWSTCLGIQYIIDVKKEEPV